MSTAAPPPNVVAYDCQNYMNSVERVVQYSRADMIPQEPAHEIEDHKPDPSWPEDGSITFEDITMSYRKGLPNVLKGISLEVEGGEKIGVVGRYTLAFLLLEVNHR